MDLLITLSAELAGLAATSGAILLTALLLRNPCNPKWVGSEWTALAASLLLVGLLSTVVAVVMEKLLEQDFRFLAATGMTIGPLIGSTILFWVVFRLGERFEQADPGGSPFGALKREKPRPSFQADLP